MKNLLILAIAAMGLLNAGPVIAQLPENTVRATVPFSFFVGNSDLLPSGTYVITPIRHWAVQVRHTTEPIAVMYLAMPNGRANEEPARLLFNKYGGKYFLNEIHGRAVSTGLVLPVSAHEQRVRSDMATVRTEEMITLPKELEQEELEQPDN